MGGAQAIAALAYGPESVPAVDVIAGPGNVWVQEAKRLVAGDVGIDGIAGPSELVVIASEKAEAELVALDLLAQAEHGSESFIAAISPDAGLLDAVEADLRRLAAERSSVTAEQVALFKGEDPQAALRLAEKNA